MHTTTTTTIAQPTRDSSLLRRFVGVVAEPQSYRNLAYLLLGLPLGTLWFTLIVTGVSVSISMLVVALLGIPMLLGDVVRDPRLRQRRTCRLERVARSRTASGADVLVGRRQCVAPTAGDEQQSATAGASSAI